MAGRKPPPRTLDPDEDRKIQRFLERAAPVVLENPVIDTQRWGQLVALAEELELSDDQLRRTVMELLDRGVIKKVDIASPKPPPLPDHIASASEETISKERGEADFSLAPPPPPPGKQKSRLRQTEEGGAESIQQFQRTATAIIARHRGTGPKAQILLAAAAEELGLTEDQARLALDTLQQPEVQPPGNEDPEPPVIRQEPPVLRDAPWDMPWEPPSPGTTADDELARRRWRVEGEPEPEPPPPPKEPAEIFRDYAQQSLAQIGGTEISSKLEQRLMTHGIRVLGLSRVYVRHILAELAEEGQLALGSATGRSWDAKQPEIGPELCGFLDSAAPILAQHRGINAKSRVMINALAREHGLSDAQMERALALLQHRPAAGEEGIQKEREEAFRDFVRTALKQLPHAILTANVESKLSDRGRLLHGVLEDRIGPVIREAADMMKVSVVSQEQAEQHLKQLITELMGEAIRLQAETRDRIHAEGKQWGLSEEQIELAIRDRSQSNYRRQRSERRFTNAALVGASLALLTLIGFISWTMVDDQLVSAPRPPRPAEFESLVPPPSDPDKDDSWWPAELSFAIAMARQEFPQLRSPLMEIAALGSERRAAAYEQLVAHLLEEAIDDSQRSRLMDVLAWCYALEPDEATAGRISAALLRIVPAPEATLSEDVDTYSKVFWAMRTAISGLVVAPRGGARAESMARALGLAVGETVDFEQSPRSLERQCLGALAERLYRLLISAAAVQPEAVTAIHRAIAEEAKRYLDAVIVANLNADFLVALLSGAADVWRKYEDLIVQTISSSDPLAVVKLVDLYERTSNRELQEFMSGPLLRRAGALAESHTVAEIAGEVRRALGVSDDDPAVGRWLQFSRGARHVLARTRAATTPDDLLLQDVIELAHWATLGCALSQDELGHTTFDDLQRKGPPTLTDALALPREEPSYERGRASVTMIEQSLDLLKNRRSSPVARVTRLEYLARAAPRYPDVLPRHAQILAYYLFMPKSDIEHNKVLEHVNSIAQWKHVRLALADGVEAATLRPDQLQSLLAEILGRDVTGDAGEVNRKAARSRLLDSVLTELNAAATRSSSQTRSYDGLQSRLRELYGIQSRLLVAAADGSAGSPPSNVLRALIQGYVAKRIATAREPAVRQELERLPHELAAVEYVAANELQLMILLERQWIRVLAHAVSERFPERQSEVDRIWDALVVADRAADHIAVQLRDGQAAMVQLWLLWNEPK